MFMNSKRLISLCALMLLLSAALRGGLAHAQERTPAHGAAQTQNEEVVRVNTRVVFLDALVRDERTGAPVTGLARENFEVRDNGRVRPLTYFSNQGVGRPRPLALVLTLNLTTGAILYLERPEIMEQIIAALDGLRPEDEVAVMMTWYEPCETCARALSFVTRSRMVEGFTRDRAVMAAALRSAQAFARENLPRTQIFFSAGGLLRGGLGAAGIGSADPSNPPFEVTVAPDYEDIIQRAPFLASQVRPDSQVVVAKITDDLEEDLIGRSEATAQRLIGSGATVSGLIVSRNSLGMMINAVGHMLAPLMRARLHTTAYYSRQTGGEVVTARAPEQFGAGIRQIISGLAGRYSLGFTLGEDERDDRRMRRLDVRVREITGHGRARRLRVNARRGYYLSEITPGQGQRGSVLSGQEASPQ